MKKTITSNFAKLLACLFLVVGVLTGCSSANVGAQNNNKQSVTNAVNSIADLQNTENFRHGALKHILEGEINKRGKAVGFHYEGFPGSKGKVIEGTSSKPNKYGVYTAEVEVDGVKKTSNKGRSTLYPKDWTPQQVVDAINEAYNDRQYVKGSKDTYMGETKEGMQISMYLDQKTGKIISAFPMY
ncbi:EndoU domain-containing protein [Clostridium chrysemydis]|uniref:EndoU domain-containing protein n=1 Tax=Clostridium chrysemydis TaxID=2665504 RepID=UPI003F2F141C